MNVFLSVILSLFLMVFAVPTADADIFLKKDSGSSDKSSRSIFLSPNRNNSGERKLPTYNIMNKNAVAPKRDTKIDYGSAAQRLQAQKLRESRNNEYKRRRDRSINLATLSEDYKRWYGVSSYRELLDDSAYKAALKSESAVIDQVASQNAQQTSTTEKYSQQLDLMRQQALQSAAENNRRIQVEREIQEREDRSSRRTDGIILVP